MVCSWSKHQLLSRNIAWNMKHWQWLKKRAIQASSSRSKATQRSCSGRSNSWDILGQGMPVCSIGELSSLFPLEQSGSKKWNNMKWQVPTAFQNSATTCAFFLDSRQSSHRLLHCQASTAFSAPTEILSYVGIQKGPPSFEGFKNSWHHCHPNLYRKTNKTNETCICYICSSFFCPSI